jgi:hypothetical protein
LAGDATIATNKANVPSEGDDDVFSFYDVSLSIVRADALLAVHRRASPYTISKLKVKEEFATLARRRYP